MIIPKLPKSFILAKNNVIKEVASIYSMTQLNEYSRVFQLNDPVSTIFKKTNGWEVSHQLIDTPNIGIRTWLIIDEYLITPNLMNYKIQDNILSYTFCDKPITVDLFNINYEIELLAFYYRLGYQIVEKEGIGYYISEPIGTQTFVDLTFCNCINYLKENDCLHLILARAYHKHRNQLEESLSLCPN